MLKQSTTFLLFAAALLAQPAPDPFDPALFKNPPADYRGHAMWGFNLSKLTEDAVISSIRNMAKTQHGGFFIEATAGPTTGLSEAYLKLSRRKPSDEGVVYLSDEYFRFYKLALEEARKNGLSVLLYDDWSFPTGTVAGQLYSKHPQHVAKILEMTEKDVTGPSQTELAIPEGIYLGAVMMNRDTFQLIDASDRRTQANRVIFRASKGNWKVMVFYLTVGKARFVDYLDDTAMDVFISMSYQKYYDSIGSYFGNLIKTSFFDEPAMHNADGRMWTPAFNANFQRTFGYSPMKYYPALWYDIGPQTAAARNALFGFRAQLYADNFVKKLGQWCAAHGIQLGGHFDQEEIVNPVPVNGDLMKLFEHQGVPGVDDIWWYGRSNPAYKIVTSAAFNYDKPICLAETYAAYFKLDEKIAFQVAMDQYAMGINFQVPASSRARHSKVAELNQYAGRLSYLLQHGRHVADVAVLYPIAALQSAYKFVGGQQSARPADEPPPQIFSGAYAREGGLAPAEIDYQDIGEALYRGLRVDYTYLHPEVLVSRCNVEKPKLVLNNRENREEYAVLILPGGDTLSAAAAAKIKEFYDQGGTVIATRRLPARSAEFGRDKEVQRVVAQVFGVPVDGPLNADVRRAQDRTNYHVFWYYVKRNQAGGQAFFLPNSEPWLLDFTLKQALPVRDVDIQEPMWLLKRGPDYDGALTYLHKVKNGRDIYFFANSSDKPVDTKVVLRGRKTLRIWNPHTGGQDQAELAYGEASGQPVTTVRLALPPVSSLFYVQEQ